MFKPCLNHEKLTNRLTPDIFVRKNQETQNTANGAAFCVVPGAGVEPAPPQWRQDFKRFQI